MLTVYKLCLKIGSIGHLKHFAVRLQHYTDDLSFKLEFDSKTQFAAARTPES